jgi:hypothetical protein
MDFLIEEKTLDINLLECENSFCKAIDTAIIEFASHPDANSLFYEMTLDDFKEKISGVIKKILESLKEFFQKIRVQLSIKVEQFKLNKKLEELKDLMAKKKAKILGTKYSYFDIQKYKAYYTDFINRYTAELKKGLNKNFKNVDEYERWRVSMLNKLSDFNFKLSDEEQWKLSITINGAVELTEKEAMNREKNLKMVEEDGTRALKDLERHYKQIDLEHSQVNISKDGFRIFKMQNSFLAMVCNKIAQAIKTVVRIITRHPFECITALIVLLIAM